MSGNPGKQAAGEPHRCQGRRVDKRYDREHDIDHVFIFFHRNHAVSGLSGHIGSYATPRKRKSRKGSSNFNFGVPWEPTTPFLSRIEIVFPCRKEGTLYEIKKERLSQCTPLSMVNVFACGYSAAWPMALVRGATSRFLSFFLSCNPAEAREVTRHIVRGRIRI